MMQAQGGWVRGKSELFSKVDYTHFNSTTYYAPNGDKIATAQFRQRELNVYGEYGITSRFTSILQMPLLRANSSENTNVVYGLGDAKIELKYRLTPDNKIPIAISIVPELPIGRSNAFAKAKSNPLDIINLATGDGEWNVWSTVAASIPLGKVYFSAYGSYNFRTKYEGKDFQDIYQIGGEIGGNLIPNFWVNAKVKAQYSTGEGQHPELTFVRGDATTYTLLSAEALYFLTKNWGISATFLTGSDVLSNRKNIFLSPYLSIGIIYKNF